MLCKFYLNVIKLTDSFQINICINMLLCLKDTCVYYNNHNGQSLLSITDLFQYLQPEI